MKLYLNGQDIATLVLGSAGEKVGSEVIKKVAIGPEGYMKVLQDWLKEYDVTLNDIETIYAVCGPGSPTALRTILSIVNTLHFAKKIAVVPVEKEPDFDDAEAFRLAIEGAKSISDDAFIHPVYATGPKITKSHKDALGRPLSSSKIHS